MCIFFKIFVTITRSSYRILDALFRFVLGQYRREELVLVVTGLV